MTFSKSLWRTLGSLTLLMLSAQTLGMAIKVTDQFGSPLKDAVVAFTTTDTLAVPKSVAVMDQVNKHFVPTVLIVQRGQFVNFPNSDDIRHHVYSFSEAKPFQLKLYSGQPEQPLQFDSAGLVVLGCNIHDSMVGYIYVSEGEIAKKTDINGIAEFQQQPANNLVSIWHPQQAQSIESKKTVQLTTSDTQVVSIEVTQPAPRNTFADKFKNNND